MTAPITCLARPIERAEADFDGEDARARIDRRGKRLPSTRTDLMLRDAFIADAVLAFFPALSATSAARELSRRMSLYHGGAWRRHRAEAQLPARLVGRPEELFWHIFRLRDAVPSQRVIRRAIDRARKRYGWPYKGLFVA